MNSLINKKILILGGTYQHIKIVEAAKKLGVYTVVTDYLSDSPAKKIADKSYLCNIKDIDGLVDICIKEKIDGVIAGYIDPAQKPYNELCEKLGFPCLGNKKQFYKMSNKRAFKNMCKENNVDIIEEYTEQDIKKERITYPVFVKPVDSRGSRGQSICYNEKELIQAIKFAKEQSSNDDIIIERYIEKGEEFQVTYFYVNGKPYLIRTVDSYKGDKSNNLDNVVSCAISPSKYTNEYINLAQDKVLKMFKKLGIKNGPIFMQGFKDKNCFRFFDPGLRFPGVDYERIYKKVFNIDLMELMVIFALTGEMPDIELPENSFNLNSKKAAVLFPNIKKGTIKQICGVEDIINSPHIISYIPRYHCGDNIEWTYDINQRFAEIDILDENIDALSNSLKMINSTLQVYDESNEEMLYQKFDTTKLEGFYNE